MTKKQLGLLVVAAVVIPILAVAMWCCLIPPEWVAACASLLTVVIAAAAVLYARKAVRLAKETLAPTQKTLHLSLITHLADAYSSTEMLRGLLALREWKEQEGEGFAAKLKFKKLRKADYKKVKRVDEGRRLFAHYMYEVVRLRKEHIMTEKEERSLVDDSQVKMLFEVCKPLEEAINPKYDTKTFDHFKPRYHEILRKKQKDTTPGSPKGETDDDRGSLDSPAEEEGT